MYHIAFATPNYDVWDIRRGSGSYYHICQELVRRGNTVTAIGPINYGPPIMTRGLKKIATWQKKRYRSWQDFFAARAIGKIVTEQLSTIDYDFLLTNDYSVAAYAPTNKPIILYTDSVFPRHYQKNEHPWLSNLPWFNVIACQGVTRRSLSRVKLCCIPTSWGIEILAQYKTFDRSISHMIPFGSNLDDTPPDAAQAREQISLKEKEHIQLLFVGRDWKLKGGAIALETAEKLHGAGIKVEVHVVGSTPQEQNLPPYVKLHGLLNKDIPDEQEKLLQLFRSSDIFILPTRAEGFGIVFAEAASFGLPSLAFDTTGVSTAVKDGQSGVLIPLETPNPAQTFAETIMAWREQPEQYRYYVSGARRYYEETVNWKAAVSNLLKEVDQVL